MHAAQYGDPDQLAGCDGSCRSEASRARGRLDAQAAMRAAVVIADVLAQDALGVALAEDYHVVETVATERPHQALANRVRQRRSWRREKTSHSEAAEPGTETRIVDAVAVVQQIARGRVGDGLNARLGVTRRRIRSASLGVSSPDCRRVGILREASGERIQATSSAALLLP
jgi:hypothetical protein